MRRPGAGIARRGGVRGIGGGVPEGLPLGSARGFASGVATVAGIGRAHVLSTGTSAGVAVVTGVGDFDLVEGGDPPTIAISGTVLPGETLTATHDGDTVQWYAGGVALTGETADTYVVDAADDVFGPDIDCRATNDNGTTTSNALAFDYGDMSGLRGGADPALVTLNGSDVASFTTRGTGGNVFATVGGVNEPEYEAADATFNNEPTAHFTTAEYVAESAFSWGTSVGAFTTLFVGAVDTFANNSLFWSYDTANPIYGRMQTGPIYVTRCVTVFNAGTETWTAGEARACIAQWDSATDAQTLDRVAAGATAQDDSDTNTGSAVADNAAFGISATGAGATGSTMTLALFLVWDRALTADEKTALAKYVEWRFGR